MSASEPVVEPSRCIQANLEHVNEQATLPTTNDHDNPATKRSDKLRHAFPRSSRRSIHYVQGSGGRVSRTDHPGSAVLYRRQLKPRGTFHRVINSFFRGHSGRGARTSPRDRSRASSSGTPLGSSVQGSVPSLDLISPGIFLFSGPRLQSAGSYNDSASWCPVLTGSLREVSASHHNHSDSYSMLDITSVEEELLEPVVGQGVVRSMSNVLLGVNTPIQELGDPLLYSRDGGMILTNTSRLHDGVPLSQTISPRSSSAARDLLQEPAIAALILRHVDTTTQKRLTLVCRSWCDAIKHAASPTACPASTRLPTEILLSIYNYLSARDFNACRRTCRSWMVASLNESLLGAMLHRGGWHDGSPATDNGHTPRKSTAASSHEWRLSRYLARQCALAGCWTGNGLDSRSVIVESTAVDFSDLADGFSLHRSRSGGALIFTASVCGQYLLVAKDTLIYVYQLDNGQLEPVSCVICPRRVLAMSMNASVGRNAVAALLEGRMGMIYELRHGCRSEVNHEDTGVEGNGHPPRPSFQSFRRTERDSDLRGAALPAAHASGRIIRSFPHIQGNDPSSFDAIELKAHDQGFDLRDTDDATTYDRSLINQTWNLRLHGPLGDSGIHSNAAAPVQSIPIESGTSTFYRHLCSEDDPPRNVSICPQRRCVAFGCSAGIELHWIDALTGQSLSRWFPLTSPSDHLYFVSPRPGFESAKKLRLISSAAHPNERPAISRRFFSSAAISSFWGPFGFERRSQRPESCDHYHAIPLSDGFHVLYIDPSTERLMLGCDAPLGGPARLVRKVVLTPPEGQDVPRVYTAAADMSSGARVVAVFGDVIMLYSVPPDVLALSRVEQAAESLDVYSTAPFSTTGREHDHWLNWWEGSPSQITTTGRGSDNDSPIWPVSLSGTEIGKLPDVCELAIQTRPDIVIWAFTFTSQCRTWRLHSHVDPVITSRQYVDQSGVVHDAFATDESRDVIMQDAPSSSVASAADGRCAARDDLERPAAEDVRAAGVDGAAAGVLKKMAGALAVENDGWVDTVDVAGCEDAWFEGNGDVVRWYAL